MLLTKQFPRQAPYTWAPTGNKRIKNWWNDLCSTAVEAKNIAKKVFQRHPSVSTAIEYKHSSAKVKKKNMFTGKKRGMGKIYD